MALTGDTYSVYLTESYIPTVTQTVFWNSWYMSQPFFEIVQPGACPSGTAIRGVLDYAVTTNAEVYVQGAPMPDPDTLSTVEYYHTKDYFQVAAKVYGDTISQLGGKDSPIAQIAPREKAISTSIKNAVDLAATTLLTDLGSQVDSTTTYSDSALNRTTYSIASYEAGAGGALAIADLDDALEALQDNTYGVPDYPQPDNLVWLMARNQKTNLATLTLGTTSYVYGVSQETSTTADAGKMRKLDSYDSIPILVVPDMTNTEMYLVRRDATKLFMHEGMTTVVKDPAEWAEQWLTTFGINLVITNPRCCAKITGITA